MIILKFETWEEYDAAVAGIATLVTTLATEEPE